MTDATPAANLAGHVRELLDQLAHSSDPAAFAELLGLQEHLGIALGLAARSLADDRSWASVAGLAGTTRQAAWARWHG